MRRPSVSIAIALPIASAGVMRLPATTRPNASSGSATNNAASSTTMRFALDASQRGARDLLRRRDRMIDGRRGDSDLRMRKLNPPILPERAPRLRLALPARAHQRDRLRHERAPDLAPDAHQELIIARDRICLIEVSKAREQFATMQRSRMCDVLVALHAR